MKTTLRSLALSALLLSLAPGCKKVPPPQATAAKAPAPAAESPTVESEATPAGTKQGADEAPQTPTTDPKANAEGAAVVPNAQVANCPASLAGTDEVDRTIPSSCGTIQVTDAYRIDGCTLTIEAGVTLAFAPGSSLTVGEWKAAKLVVKGTADKPVTFTSAGDKAAGVWRGLALAANADRSTIAGLVIEWAGADDYAALSVSECEGITLSGATIRNAKGYGLDVDNNSAITVSGSTFESTGAAAMRMGFKATGGIASDNVFAKDPTGVVQVTGGASDISLTWKNVGAPWVIPERLGFDGKEGAPAKWTIEAGATILAGTDAGIFIGEWQSAALVVSGDKDKPVRFGPVDTSDSGTWPGLTVSARGTATLTGAELSGVRGDDTAAIYAADGAQLRVKASSFKSSRVGVNVAGASLQAFDENHFEGVGTALKGPPALLAHLGSANTYSDDTTIVVGSGALDGETPVSWTTQNVRVDFTDSLAVDTTLTIQPGARLRFAEDCGLNVGAWGRAKLVVNGTAEAPVTISGVEARAGAWPGLSVAEKGKVELTHVAFSDTGADGAVRVSSGAEAKLTNVSATRSQGPALTWDCGAKVEHVEVTAGEGTETAEKAPEGCE